MLPPYIQSSPAYTGILVARKYRKMCGSEQRCPVLAENLEITAVPLRYPVIYNGGTGTGCKKRNGNGTG